MDSKNAGPGHDANDILKRARMGDLEAFDLIVRENQAWVRAFLRARIRDWASADDLAQDVFVTAFRKLKSFRGESSLESWLRGIAHNHLRNFIRKRREDYVGGNVELQVIADAACDRWSDRGSEHARTDALRECLDSLDGNTWEVVTQRYVVGKTVREIAADTGRGYSALTMQLHRVRESLAKCIEGKTETGSI